MPWKECSVMDERLQFVARRLAGEAMSELCREFGIARKTGYKIFDRYQNCGVEGLTDRSRRPYRYAHQLPFQVENFILNVKRSPPPKKTMLLPCLKGFLRSAACLPTSAATMACPLLPPTPCST